MTAIRHPIMRVTGRFGPVGANDTGPHAPGAAVEPACFLRTATLEQGSRLPVRIGGGSASPSLRKLRLKIVLWSFE